MKNQLILILSISLFLSVSLYGQKVKSMNNSSLKSEDDIEIENGANKILLNKSVLETTKKITIGVITIVGGINTGSDLTISNTTIKASELKIIGNAVEFEGVTIDCDKITFENTIQSISIKKSVKFICHDIELLPVASNSDIKVSNTGVAVLSINYDHNFTQGRKLIIDDKGNFKVNILKN